MRKLSLVLAAALGLFAAPRQPYSSEAFWEYRSVADPQISPDGKNVVYTMETPDKASDTFQSHLWFASAGGKDNRPLTTGPYKDTYPRWSPDGTRIAYLSNRSGKTQIHVRWVEGGQDIRLTQSESSPISISWSPDGRWIAFAARIPARPAWELKLAAAPPGAKWAEPPTVITRLNWRADRIPGQGVIPNGDVHVFVVAASGGALRNVSPDGATFDGEPSWTPDGTGVVASGVKLPEGDRKLFAKDLWWIPVAGGESKRITTVDGNEESPAISPDGRRVAYLGFEDKGNSNHTTHLWVMNLDGSGRRAISASADRNVLSPKWKADSSGLYAIAESRGEAHVNFYPLDGPVIPITHGKDRFATAYAVPDAMSVSANGQVAVGMSTPAQPKEIYTFSVNAPTQLARISSANDGILAKYEQGAAEEIVYPSFDGKQIQGWIVKPPRFDPSKKYPLLLDIHGGPHAMDGVEFTLLKQVYAGSGFVVLYTNPRGSTGYGEEFGNIIHAKYPGDDFHDLMAGVDAVVARGYVDAKKLTVTGGSGGGILTAWIVTHTHRFAAAVSQYPVTNWFTQTGASDIQLTMARWMKAAPWENPQQYISRSPLFFAGEVTTPTLILTGEEDWRTPIAQSEEFYTALKMRNVETALVRFPHEPHGIRGGYPSHRVARAEYVMGWMARFIK